MFWAAPGCGIGGGSIARECGVGVVLKLQESRSCAK